MSTISKIFTSIFLGIQSLFGIHQQAPLVSEPQPVALGAFNPTGGGTYRLQSSITSSGTSITLASFKEPISNIPYTMSYLNSSVEYGTLEPQSNNKEFISFTGITQNSDGSATLTGVSRGLAFSYPYTASTTLQQAHSGQTIFILSNPPQLYNQYANKSNNETITGQWTFTSFPLTASNSTSSYMMAGVAQLAGPLDQAASTATSSNGNGAPLILAAKNATSTYNSATASNVVVVTRTNGTVDPNFVFPTQTTASTSLQTNGSTVMWGNYNLNLPIGVTYPVAVSTASTTIMTSSVPAGMMGTNNTLHGHIIGNVNVPTGDLWIDVAFGTATTTLLLSTASGNTPPLILDFYIQNRTASTQYIASYASGLASSTAVFSGTENPITFASTTASQNTAVTKSVTVVGKTNTGAITGSALLGTLELLRQ